MSDLDKQAAAYAERLRQQAAQDHEPSTDLVPVGRVVTVVDLATGEHVDPRGIRDFAPELVEYVTGDLATATSDDFADALERLDELTDAVNLARQSIRARVVAMLDKKGGKRKALIGGTEWETNAPKRAVLDADRMKDVIPLLIDADLLDEEGAAALIRSYEPKPPEPDAVNATPYNALLKSLEPDDGEEPSELYLAVKAVRSMTPQGRTLKIVGRTPVAEAVEELEDDADSWPTS